MPAYAALLRAVNVGGTGKLAMSDLTAMCEAEGYTGVRTYIASGNVVFHAAADEARVKAALERRLSTVAGKPVAVLVRTAAELEQVLAANPFSDEPPNRTLALFLDRPPPADALATVANRRDERLALGTREIYVAYGSGMADSKLRVPAAAATPRERRCRGTSLPAAASPPDDRGSPFPDEASWPARPRRRSNPRRCCASPRRSCAFDESPISASTSVGRRYRSSNRTYFSQSRPTWPNDAARKSLIVYPLPVAST